MLFRRKRKTPQLSRRQTLACRVVRNPEVIERIRDAGDLELTLALKPARWTRLLGRDPEVPAIRKYQLDDLGRYVWEQAADSPTVESLIRQFAEHHKINIRESEVSVTAFLRSMMQRGLVGMAVAEPGGPEARNPKAEIRNK